MFHLLFGPLLPTRRSDRLTELGAIAERLGAATLLLSPTLRPPTDAPHEIARLEHEVIELRRKLEIRLARAAVHAVDPRLICEAVADIAQVVRLIARVVRCRQWLGLKTAPAEALELEAAAGQGGQLLAESARAFAGSRGWLAESQRADSIKRRAEELYSRGVARAFEGFPDPLDVLRQKTLYDALFGVILGSDRALESLREASLQ